MSYYWTQDTAPMTSIVVLQRALTICGFDVKLDGENLGTPVLFDELAHARERITLANGSEESIAAYEAYIGLIRKFEHLDAQLPSSITLSNRERWDLDIHLVRNLLGYSASGESGSRLEAHRAPTSVRRAIAALNNAYKSVARELEDERHAVLTSLTNTRVREAARKMIEAERASYRESVKKAKEKIHQTLVANAEKEGYEIKKSTFRKGKNAGREQYVLVRRT